MIVGRDYRMVGQAETFDPTQRRFKARAMTRTVLTDSVGFYDPDGADLTLLNAGGRPLLLDHVRSVRSIIGTIEAAWIEDDAVQVICRMGHGPDAELAWANIRAGIWCAVSLGNRVLDVEPLPGGPYRVRAWQPHELSLVWSGWCGDAVIDDAPDERDFARVHSLMVQRRRAAEMAAAQQAEQSMAQTNEARRNHYRAVALMLADELGITAERAIEAAHRVSDSMMEASP